MKLKQLVTSLTATFDDFVIGVENHEAVAASAITDVRRAAARLRAQRGQLDARIQRQQQSIDELRAQRDRWQARAAQHAESDPDQGLLCLRRRDAAENSRQTLNNQLDEQLRLSAELASSIQQVEGRLGDLQNRRTALSSREARASALSHTASSSDDDTIDELFERWEAAVINDEYREGAAVGVSNTDLNTADHLDQTLLAEERDEALKRELAALGTTQTQENIQ